MVTVVDNTVLYKWNLLKKKNFSVLTFLKKVHMEGFRSVSKLNGRNPSQCICISNYQIIHFKYLTILFVNFTSVKVEEKGHANATVSMAQGPTPKTYSSVKYSYSYTVYMYAKVNQYTTSICFFLQSPQNLSKQSHVHFLIGFKTCFLVLLVTYAFELKLLSIRVCKAPWKII